MAQWTFLIGSGSLKDPAATLQQSNQVSVGSPFAEVGMPSVTTESMMRRPSSSAHRRCDYRVVEKPGQGLPASQEASTLKKGM